MRPAALALVFALMGWSAADSRSARIPRTLDFPEAAHACSPTAPRSPPARLVILPDAGDAPLVASLAKATRSIRLMAYDLAEGRVLSTLLDKARAGVDVRVILARTQKGVDEAAFDALVDAGARVRWSDPRFTFMHAKTFVVDGREAVVSTGNFVARELEQDRNYAVVLDDPDDVANLVALFDADWAKEPPDLGCTRLIVSPVNAKARILGLIEGATRTLDIESMEFADRDVQEAVAAAQRAGVAVRVLLASTRIVPSNERAQDFLRSHDIPGKTLERPVVHVKSILVDGERAYLGSENLTATSLRHNREVGVELTTAGGEDVAAMQATFEKDWASGTSF